MNVLQHTRNERNLCLKQNRPDRSYRDTLLTVRWYSCAFLELWFAEIKTTISCVCKLSLFHPKRFNRFIKCHSLFFLGDFRLFRWYGWGPLTSGKNRLPLPHWLCDLVHKIGSQFILVFVPWLESCSYDTIVGW